MKSVLLMAVSMLGFGMGLQAGTVTYTWNFEGTNETLGASQVYTSSPTGGASITAYGLSCVASGCSATDLYGKNGGAGETGVGIANDPSGDHEIYPGTFVQLDLTNLLAMNPASGTLTIESVQSSEGFTLSVNNAQGSPGAVFYTSPKPSPSATITLSAAAPGTYLPSGYDFLSIGATSGNVLLSSLTATFNTDAPEPASFALVGGALLGLAALRGRKKA